MRPATAELATLDEVALPDASIGIPRVEIALVPAGTPAEEVNFEPTATTEGRFSATLPARRRKEMIQAYDRGRA